MNLLDVFIIMIFLSFFVMGFKNGVIREVVNLVGIILVLVVSYLLKDWIGYYLCIYAPFFEFSGALKGFSSFNILMYQGISFFIVFGVLLSIYAMIVKTSALIQKIVNLTIILILPSKILGGIVGILKGWLLLFMSLIILMIPFGSSSFIRESSLTKKILYQTPVISNYTGKFMNSLKDVYEMVHQVRKKKITSTEADIKSIKIMLDYKMVNRKTVETLLEKNKLANKEEIQSLLNQY